MMVSLLNKRRSHGQLSILSSEMCNMKGPSCRASSRLPWKLPVERCNTASLVRSIHHCPSHSSLAISTWDVRPKANSPKKAVFREGRSIHHVLDTLIPVKRKEGELQKLPTVSIPSSITKEERAGRSIDQLSLSYSLSMSKEKQRKLLPPMRMESRD